MMSVTRFAPSPTGPLHLGHAYAALVAAQRGTRFLLRIEDIDHTRARPEHVQGIMDDLSWLGLHWEEPVLFQARRLSLYEQALARLERMGVTYRCICTRADIRKALAAPQETHGRRAPRVYPGTCRHARHDTGAVRLDMAAALVRIGAWTAPPTLVETGINPGVQRMDARMMQERIGDIVLARRDIGTSYHLAVVVDDAAQGITEVTRGADLQEITPLHVLLQRLLALPTPAYHHHRLIRDALGRRLAKRDDARALASYRAMGVTPADIRRMTGFDAPGESPTDSLLTAPTPRVP